jgi:membrane protease subunit (stomatin/prohibitin family)
MAILDLIEYPDEDPSELVHRVPEYGSGEFRLGSQCVVRESQRAVFFRDGKALDVLGPGRHTLSTANIPLLTGILGIPFGGKSPFTAEVYYVNIREMTHMKWGTPNPITLRDKDFGIVRVRSFGTYSMRVADPQLFVNQVVGARGSYQTSDIEDFLRSVIVTEFTDMLAETQTAVLDIQGNLLELSTAAQYALADDFQRLGFELRTFQITSIALPEEVQQRIDERTSMAALGDMRTYTQFQAAQAIGNLGEGGGGEGSMLGDAAGLGAGLGLGAAMTQVMRDAMTGGGATVTPSPAPTGAAPAAGTRFCSNCGTALPPGAKFCPGCGNAVAAATGVCPKCSTANAPGAKFCMNCGAALS